MKQHSLVLRSLSACLLGLLFLASCKKVNEATELGGDLIPPVDNVNTFDTTLEVLTFNHPFGVGDSVRIPPSVTHFIGNISNDPLFGKSSGSMFLQLKPSIFKTPFAFTSSTNIVAIDSAVLVLSYRSVYGDSTQPLSFQVFEIDNNVDFNASNVYRIDESNFAANTPISGVNTILPTTMNDSVYLFRESAANQIRLKLNNDFGDRLLRYDSTNAYLNDSAFNSRFKGFAVKATNKAVGNSMVGVSLADSNTKLALYYRYTNASGGRDTAVTYFRFNTVTAANANYIERDRSGSAFEAVAGDNTPDPLLYIQNTPGTYGRIVIPGLGQLSNRVVHRAELQIQQVPEPLPVWLAPPSFLYLDAYDTASKVNRTLPFDALVSNTSNIDNAVEQITNAATFGMIARRGTAPGSGDILVWRFDMSRYVQHVVNGTVRPYEFRLSSPFLVSTNLSTTTSKRTILVNQVHAVGRVQVGGGNHPTQAMKLRIIYSKL